MFARTSDSSAINDFLLAKVKVYINEPFSIEIANDFYFRNSGDTNQLRKLYTILADRSDAIRNLLLNLYQKIEKLLTINNIDFASFQFYDKSKNLSSLKLLKEKMYLVDFWFTEYIPYIKEHKLIVSKIKDLTSKNIEVVGISIDKSHEKWKNYLEKMNYHWENFRETEGIGKGISTSIKIEEFPTYLLADSEGVIHYRASSFSDMQGYLTTLRN